MDHYKNLIVSLRTGHLNPHQISLRSVQWFHPRNGVKYNDFVHFFLCLSIYLSIYVCMYQFTFTPPQAEPLDRFGRLIGQNMQTAARNDPFWVKSTLLKIVGVICPPICPNLARYRDLHGKNRGRSPSIECVARVPMALARVQRALARYRGCKIPDQINHKTRWLPAWRPSCFLEKKFQFAL